jgi:hypothetical protein
MFLKRKSRKKKAQKQLIAGLIYTWQKNSYPTTLFSSGKQLLNLCLYKDF